MLAPSTISIICSKITICLDKIGLYIKKNNIIIVYSGGHTSRLNNARVGIRDRLYKKSFTVRPTGYDVLRKQLRSQIVDLHLLWTSFGNWMEGQTSIIDCVLGYSYGRGWVRANRFYHRIRIIIFYNIYWPVSRVLIKL